LIEYGKNPETPVAIIERGCTDEQRVIVGKLSNITDIAEKENVEAPAIIVIGDVVRLREKLLPFLDL
jgi:siroheme synthase